MHRTTIHAHTHALIDDKHTCPVICKLTCKWYDTQTHNHTHRCWCETNTHSRSRTCLGRATPSRQLMDVKQKWRGEKWNKPSRRGDHRLGARPREKGRKSTRRECSLQNKTVFSLPAVKGAGLRNRASWQPEAQSPPSSTLSPITPLTLLSSSPLSLFSSVSPALPPSCSSRQRVTLGRYFHFFKPSVHTVSITVDSHSFLTD